MYRGNNKKLEESYFNNTFNSTLSETTNQLFEKEIDSYTRILQQDKRKFFRAQQNRNETIKDYTIKQKELEYLKSKQYKTQTMRKKAEVKILEGQLDQAINSYNQITAYNKKLKAEIDELRKEKLNQKEAMRRLNSKIQEFSSAVEERQSDIVKKQESIEISKQDILKIKHENQNQAKSFRQDVTIMQGSLAGNKSRSYLFKRRSQLEGKADSTDTQPLVRYRLKKLINSNKQKIRIVQSYRKGMHAIWQSFEEIKQQSGINDLQQITNTFLKHEEQNHFIYEYIHKLNKEIEELNEQNTNIRQKIEEKKKQNEQNLKILKDTPQKSKSKIQQEHLIQSYEAKIAGFQVFLQESSPIIAEFMTSIGSSAPQQLTQFNIQEYLAQIQSFISIRYVAETEAAISYKQEMTKYARAPPNITDELRQPKEQKLLDGQKLREFACDYWQKKKVK